MKKISITQLWALAAVLSVAPAAGAFIIPIIFGQQIKAGHAEYALYGFTVYYVICLFLNWFFYDRKNSSVDC